MRTAGAALDLKAHVILLILGLSRVNAYRLRRPILPRTIPALTSVPRLLVDNNLHPRRTTQNPLLVQSTSAAAALIHWSSTINHSRQTSCRERLDVRSSSMDSSRSADYYSASYDCRDSDRSVPVIAEGGVA